MNGVVSDKIDTVGGLELVLQLAKEVTRSLEQLGVLLEGEPLSL